MVHYDSKLLCQAEIKMQMCRKAAEKRERAVIGKLDKALPVPRHTQGGLRRC